MCIDLTSEEKVSFLVSLSHKMGVSEDEVLAMYLFLEDKIFFLFDLFQGRSVKFPSMRSFHRNLSFFSGSRVLALKKPSYVVNGSESYREDIVAGDLVFVDGCNVLAVSSPMRILGGTYILVKDISKEEKNEEGFRHSK